MKLNLKRIIRGACIFLLVLVLFTTTTQVFGAINPDNDENAVINGIKDVIAWLLGSAMGAITAPIAQFMNAIILIVFVFLYFVFSPVSGGLAFPFPDQIVFNKLAFFDVNFINPAPEGVNKAPVVILQGLISNMYYTCFVIAGAVFIIAAMIIGIKLATSSIAQEKAQYKEALTKWLVGLVLLFTTHFIMAGIFALNEFIVHTVSKAAGQIEFTVNLFDLGGITGKMMKGILTFVKNLVSDSTWSVGDLPPIRGYGGLVVYFIAKAIGGDIVASIVGGIILGQTVALVIMYTKRLFYSILLGMIAPLIVAADVIKKSF